MTGNIKIAHAEPAISISWNDVFDVVTEIGTHGISSLWGKIPNPSDVANILNKARKSLRVDLPIESEALRLVLLCFASAIDEVRPRNSDKSQLLSARETISTINKIVANHDYFLNRSFFQNPISLPLYQDIRSTFISGLSNLWPSTSEIGGKLDCAFNSALYKIVKREKDLVQNLLSISNGPGSTISELEEDWAIYRNTLSHSFRVKPVFGQEETQVSLSQIFVNPRGVFEQHTGPEDNKKIELHLVDLMRNMKEWINNSDASRCVRLVRGGPGSGKSSFSKSICASLSDNENIRPIFIELQRLPNGSSLLERVADLLMDREEVFRHNPLKKDLLDQNRPLLLVFDGLDELVVPKSQGVQKIAEDFWDDLDDLLATLNSDQKIRVKAMVTGREPIIQAAQSSRRGRKLDKRDALRIIGLGEQKGRFASITGCSIDDQRGLWWETYAKATGARLDTPPILENEKLSTLTAEPLLCYLIALSGKAEESHENDISNINDIYEKLVQDVWLRVWGNVPPALQNAHEDLKVQHRRVGPLGVFNSQIDFERVLEYISIAAWRGGESRTATLKEFNDAIRETEVDDIWQDFQKSYSQSNADENFATLALTFFFKEGEGDGQGFEFTHRSFGEYLTGRSLWRYWETNLSRLSKIRRIDDLSDWTQLTTGATITPEILEFLKNEFLRKDETDLQKYKDCISKCFELVIAHGFPIRLGDNECWRDAERKQRNAEGAMLCCLSAVSVSLMRKSDDVKSTSVGFEKNSLGRAFLTRIGISEESLLQRNIGMGAQRNSIYRQSLSGITFSETIEKLYDSKGPRSERPNHNCDYDILRIFGSDISYSDFSGAYLRASGISGSSMHKTIFRNACLDHAIIIECDFKSAVIDGASFLGARLESSIFSGLHLNNVNFEIASLERCDFQDCKFSAVNLSKASLVGANFSRADLSDVSGIMQSQINKSRGDEKTKLPKGINTPKTWLDNKKTQAT